VEHLDRLGFGEGHGVQINSIGGWGIGPNRKGADPKAFNRARRKAAKAAKNGRIYFLL
jgi:hypothetical protein